MTRNQINKQIAILADVHFRDGKSDILDDWALCWDWADGSEGGMIDIDKLDHVADWYYVADFDGCIELPAHVSSALQSINIGCD